MSGTLILVPDANSPGKHDATGAFWPAAQAFARFRGEEPDAVIRHFPAAMSMAARRKASVEAIDAVYRRIDTLAVFCHGYKTGIQAGFTAAQVGPLAELLKARMAREARVLLYACDTGRDGDEEDDDDREAGPGGDEGFADLLRDAAARLDHRVEVMAHVTRGHTVWNPYARRFVAGAVAKGGDWYVSPDAKLWPAWVRALKAPGATLPYRFPYLSPLELERVLSAPPAPPAVA
jgi:hypothetical protein